MPAALPADDYTLVVRDHIVGQTTNLALDGECDSSAALPSGDGLPGGYARLRFTVTD